MAASTSIQELTQRYESGEKAARELLEIPDQIKERIAEGDFDTGSALANFAVQRAGLFDAEAVEKYRKVEEAIASAEGEPVLVVTTRSFTAKKTGILKQSLAETNGGAYLGFEATQAGVKLGLSHSKHYFLGTIAAGGPTTEGGDEASLYPGLIKSKGLTTRPKTGDVLNPWLIPTTSGFMHDSALGIGGSSYVPDDITYPRHCEDAALPVFDFLEGFEPKDGFPSALNKELRTIPTRVSLRAARWSVRAALHTEVLIGEESIVGAGYEEAHAILSGLKTLPRDFGMD